MFPPPQAASLMVVIFLSVAPCRILPLCAFDAVFHSRNAGAESDGALHFKRNYLCHASPVDLALCVACVVSLGLQLFLALLGARLVMLAWADRGSGFLVCYEARWGRRKSCSRAANHGGA
jgi:hypothetical protein